MDPYQVNEYNMLGDIIHFARIRKGYTLESLSEALDITPGHLQHIENGRRNPSVPLLLELMRILEFSVDELVFPEKIPENVLYVDGLTEEQIDALARLIMTMKK